jgi:hypothetical protein
MSQGMDLWIVEWKERRVALFVSLGPSSRPIMLGSVCQKGQGFGRPPMYEEV